MTITIRLRFFASVRERLACSEETVTLPPHIHTVGQVRSWLKERGGEWEEALDHSVRTAYQQALCEASTRVEHGGELAFFPPVTGG